MKTITLDAEFADGMGKSHYLKLKQFDPTKTADQVKTALTKLTKIGLFEKDGVALFKEVLHAKVIVQEVQTIFDDRKKAKKSEPESISAMKEVAEVPPVRKAALVKKDPQPKSVKPTGQIRFPEDFTITDVQPKPGWLIKTIQLPVGLEPQDISESQAMMMITSCLPAGVSVEDLAVDEKASPAKLIITAKYEETAEPVKSANKESPPAPAKKKRKRLLKQMRKRE